MKILIDECVPFKIKQGLAGHQVYTVQMMGWSGYKNGDLIKISDPIFDCFITIDKNLSYQQNLNRLRMSIVLIEVANNKLKTILAKVDILKVILEQVEVGRFYSI